MQNTFQETVRTTNAPQRADWPETPFSAEAKKKRTEATPAFMVFGVVAFAIIAIFLSWMSNGLFLKELLVSGSIIAMLVMLRSMEKRDRGARSKSHHGNLN